ncbi:MAG: hypothetical protein NXI04_03380 [Planctomycetaceae bacterium]|nr:hypothetical protein [Planctomycetaceae bacterium]
MDPDTNDRLAARILWSWQNGCPVATRDATSSAKMAAMARRRWNSYPRRNKNKPDTTENRIDDLARGFAETFTDGGWAMVGPLIADYRWLSEQIAPLLMDSSVRVWDEPQELTLKHIQSLHVPPNQFRITKHNYETGAEFSGSARAQRLYVLTGSCRYQIGKSTWDLVAPCYVDLPDGEFQFQASDNSGVSLVHVWKLPPLGQQTND